MELFIRTVKGWILSRLGVTVHDHGVLHAHYTIEDIDPKTRQVVKRQEFDRNCLLKEGITALLNLLIGAAETNFSNANANIGIGDNDAAANSDQTGLQATTNKFYKSMEATYPQVSGQTVSFRITCLEAEANFHWREITVASGNSDAADNLNRKVQDMGEKTAAVQRVVTVAITPT